MAGFHYPQGGGGQSRATQTDPLLLDALAAITTELSGIKTVLQQIADNTTPPVDVLPECTLLTEAGAAIITEAGAYVVADCALAVEGQVLSESGAALMNDAGEYLITVPDGAVLTTAGLVLLDEQQRLVTTGG